MDIEETLKIILDKLNSMDTDIKDIKKHVLVIDTDIKDLKKNVLIIENGHGKKLDALFDGYKQVYEKVTSIDEKFEKQDVEIRVIRGAK
jgi:hypothetical protein